MLNPIKAPFEGMNSVLKDVSKAQKNFGKALDKVCISGSNIASPY